MNTSLQKLNTKKKPFFNLFFDPFFAKNSQKHKKNSVFGYKNAKNLPPIYPYIKHNKQHKKILQQENPHNELTTFNSWLLSPLPKISLEFDPKT
jgi:hypothetical protein